MSAWISYVPILSIGFIALGICLWMLITPVEDEDEDGDDPDSATETSRPSK